MNQTSAESVPSVIQVSTEIAVAWDKALHTCRKLAIRQFNCRKYFSESVILFFWERNLGCQWRNLGFWVRNLGFRSVILVFWSVI